MDNFLFEKIINIDFHGLLIDKVLREYSVNDIEQLISELNGIRFGKRIDHDQNNKNSKILTLIDTKHLIPISTIKVGDILIEEKIDSATNSHYKAQIEKCKIHNIDKRENQWIIHKHDLDGNPSGSLYISEKNDWVKHDSLKYEFSDGMYGNSSTKLYSVNYFKRD